jgi:hypothetical protein
MGVNVGSGFWGCPCWVEGMGDSGCWESSTLLRVFDHVSVSLIGGQGILDGGNGDKRESRERRKMQRIYGGFYNSGPVVGNICFIFQTRKQT